MYSFSHCFTMIPTDAEDKLKMRLENQMAFSQTAEGDAGTGASVRGRVKAGCVELTKLEFPE